MSAVFVRTTAFLTRSIRQESRLISHHVMRGLLALVILMLFGSQLSRSLSMSAAGLTFAGTILSTIYWFLTVVGMLYFSVAITEEKEEETLPLIRMTGVSAFALLLGKSIPRLAIAMLFILVVCPFIVLSITMGGVVPRGLIVSILSLVLYALVLCQIGLLSSTIASDGRRALMLSVVAWLMIEFGHYALTLTAYAFTVRNYPQAAGFTEYLNGFALEWSMISNLSTFTGLTENDQFWRPQMSFHLVLSLACFLLSLMLFNRCSARAIGQGAGSDIRHRFLLRRTGKLKSARAAAVPLAWKSWHYIIGGLPWFLFRLFAMPILGFILVLVITISLDERLEPEGLSITWMLTGVVMLIIDVARSYGRVLNDEVFKQTLGSLLMLPRSKAQIVYPLLAGLLPTTIPSIVCFLLGLTLQTSVYSGAASDVVEALTEPWFLHLFTWFLLTVHLGVLLSTLLRYGGMLIAAAAMWIAAPMLFMMFIMVVAFVLRDMGEIFARYLLPLGLMGLEVFLCVVIHILVARRLEYIGQRS
ncbi:MAG: hypothetical protein R3C20_25430 [Planctomycetaceae bacterium]